MSNHVALLNAPTTAYIVFAPSRDGTNVLTFEHSFVCVHIQMLKYHFKHSVTLISTLINDKSYEHALFKQEGDAKCLL